MKLTRGQFRLIEKWLYRHDQRPAEIRFLQEDIMFSRPPETQEQPSGRISDETAKKGIDLAIDKELRSKKLLYKRIEKALNKLCRERRDFYKLKYRDGYTQETIMQKLNIPERTYYQYRKQIVHSVVGELFNDDYILEKNKDIAEGLRIMLDLA